MRVAQPIDFDVLERGASIADLERGRSYYVQLCLPCHGASGRGDGEWAFRMTPRPADLTGRRTRGRSDETLRAQSATESPALRCGAGKTGSPQPRSTRCWAMYDTSGASRGARAAPP